MDAFEDIARGHWAFGNGCGAYSVSEPSLPKARQLPNERDTRLEHTASCYAVLSRIF